MLRSFGDRAACTLALLGWACSSPGSSTEGNANSTAPVLATSTREVATASGGAVSVSPSGASGMRAVDTMVTASGSAGQPAATTGQAGPPASSAATVSPPSAGNAATGAAGAQASAGASQPMAGAQGGPVRAQACAAMVAAAKEFISSLDSDALKSAALLPFEQHRHFAYEPQVADRPGVSLSMMSDGQKEKALALVHSGLSDDGFKKAETVRALENLKNVTLFEANMRDPKFYWLAIFGEPSDTGQWGWQWEGHHLALHYTLKACEISDTPTFVGAWPSNVMTMVPGGPPVGTRNLQQEEDLGRALAKALDADPAERMQAFNDAAYRETLPEGPDKAQPMTPAGLAASAMSDSEQMQLRQIISLYAGLMPPELASARMQRIEDHGGLQNVSFVWSGALEPMQRHFYRIQGQSFFIEYRNDDGNHIHSVWRDFDGDFGDDLP